MCLEFEELNFTIGVNCDMVGDLRMSLREVPLDTDWLCLTNCQQVTIEANSFYNFKSLRALRIHGNFMTPAKAFQGLPQLSILWICLETKESNITLLEDTFYGLNALQELKLSGMSISNMNSSIFKHLEFLTHLILQSNHITSLRPVLLMLKEFKNLQKLSVIDNDIYILRESDCVTSQRPSTNGRFIDFNISYLDLTRNLLTKSETNGLCNFPHLNFFSFEKSGMNIEDILISGIKTIKTIIATGSSFYSFEICKFSSLFKVRELLLQESNIHQFSTSKGSCNELKKLDFSINHLEAIHLGQMKYLNKLLELDLKNNKISYVKICGNDSTIEMDLRSLNLSMNFLTRLKNLQFSCLKNLLFLALDNNRINFIEDSAFDGLYELQVLDLQYNNIFIIGEFTFQNLVSVTHLNLYENVIDQIDGNAFTSLKFLQDLKLTYQDPIDIYWLHSLGYLIQYLSLKLIDLHLVNEFFEFQWLEYLELNTNYILLDCEHLVFKKAKKLYLKNVHTFQCIDSLDVYNYPIMNFTNLEKLHYSPDPNFLTDLSLNDSMKYLTKLNFLHLKDIDKLVKSGQINSHELFHGLFHLKVLHLENSGIDQLDSEDIFRDLKELEFLVIENQIMQEVKGNVFAGMPNLKYVYFLETSFPCNCKFMELLAWLEAGTSVSIINFHKQNCYVYNIEMNFVSFLQDNCQDNLDFLMFILTFVFTLLFMSISLFYESIWWYILYTFYTIKCWLRNRHRERGHYEYDAFVSYNTYIEQWVTEQLLLNLEENGPPFFKVCIHNRDFEVGRDIIENIMDSIYSSRWTICVISHSYLQSHWCSLEMRMATYRLVEESNDSLILIFLENIPREELQYYHKLIKILDKKTYLKWPEDEDEKQLFWARLRNVISNDGRKQRLQE
ncbi:toll-like receptor 12 [Engystomops pustulosus]|uniref:toll-like receptor 12 n=1 Tax=Engystomops pustulosus TaxID=76066 RepID=UPI003AFA7703